MRRVALTDMVRAVRAELVEAARDAEGIDFPVEGVEISLHIGVTRGSQGSADVDLWVLELGAERSYTTEEIQTVTIKLGKPTYVHGGDVNISREMDTRP